MYRPLSETFICLFLPFPPRGEALGVVETGQHQMETGVRPRAAGSKATPHHCGFCLSVYPEKGQFEALFVYADRPI